MLIPYAVETLEQERPTANRVIIGACVAVSVGAWLGVVPGRLVDAFVLRNAHPVALVGHMFLHAGILHLAGNMLFLWVFGNAICANVGNVVYPLLYLGAGLCAALVHLLLDGSPAIGASGAINGITGLVLAMYPLNHVHLLWIVPAGISRGHHQFRVPVWVMVGAWLVMDVLWMVAGAGGVAYWAHLGGFVAGVVLGLICLRTGWIQMTECDNRNLLEIISGSPRTHAFSSPPRPGGRARTRRGF